MDVVLDSNAYVSNYRMENISFKNLFDYLEKTGSSLVLLRIVEEEVVAKFGRALKKRSKEAAEAWREYRPLHFPEQLPAFVKPDIEDQKEQLRAKLINPAAGVKLVHVADSSNMSIADVYMRGVLRMRPARDDGEELRDVIVWLGALDYANKSKRDVAFISDDSGFWLGDAVHPQIQKDIDDQGVSVRVCRTTDHFIEENSPQPKPAEAAWATATFPEFQHEVMAAAERAFKQIMWTRSIKSASLLAFQFKEGKMYEVAPDVQVAELSFAVEILFDTVTMMVNLSTLAGPINAAEYSGLAGIRPAGSRQNVGQVFSPLSAGSGGQIPGGFRPWVNTPWGESEWGQPTTVEAKYAVSGTARVSVRLIKGKISEKEVHDFQIEKVELLQ